MNLYNDVNRANKKCTRFGIFGKMGAIAYLCAQVKSIPTTQVLVTYSGYSSYPTGGADPTSTYYVPTQGYQLTNVLIYKKTSLTSTNLCATTLTWT